MKTIITTSEINVSSVIHQAEIYESDSEAIQVNRRTNMIELAVPNVQQRLA